MSLGDFDVLIQLAETPDGALRMSELAEAVVLTRSGLTRLVDRLERRGLVERRRCPTDARGFLAVLTGEGERRLDEALVTHLTGVRRRFLDRLEPEERELLAGVWEHVGVGAIFPHD